MQIKNKVFIEKTCHHKKYTIALLSHCFHWKARRFGGVKCRTRGRTIKGLALDLCAQAD